MSETRAKILQIVNEIPENRVETVLKLLTDIQELLDIEYDMELLEEGRKAKLEDEFISFEQAVTEMGFTVEQLRN